MNEFEVGQVVVMIDKTHPVFGFHGIVKEVIDYHAIVDFGAAGHRGVDCRFDQIKADELYPAPPAPDAG